jgi:hypothetical protein
VKTGWIVLLGAIQPTFTQSIVLQSLLDRWLNWPFKGGSTGVMWLSWLVEPVLELSLSLVKTDSTGFLMRFNQLLRRKSKRSAAFGSHVYTAWALSPHLLQTLHAFTPYLTSNKSTNSPSHTPDLSIFNLLKEHLVWGLFIFLILWLGFHFPFSLSLTWAFWKHQLMWICYSWNLVFLDCLRMLGSLQICERSQEVCVTHSLSKLEKGIALTFVIG